VQIEAACDRFEAAWQEGRRPRIEDEQGAFVGQGRCALLRELLALELTYRHRFRERPTEREYQERFSVDGALVRSVFGERTAAAPPPAADQDAANPPGADRNLLFGILALQMDFISRDALFAAMNAWVLEKHKPLGEILVAQGALGPQDRALLEPMVARHVEMHGGDPEKSLAALTPSGPVAALITHIADPEVHASLAHVGTARAPRAHDPESTVTIVGEPTSGGTRFRILRLHDRGGLGEVYVARDEELRREVALKQIKEEHADDPQRRARFLVEAEITGGLEHPGIVPVYGLGTYDDGRPFYAMRFIKGDSLKDAIRRFHEADRVPGRDPGERSLALRELLGRFLDVCNAVAYAHSRGVLHRDLKPGNIMLGRFGETLVVDWGLAKSVGRPDVMVPDAERTLRPESGSGVNPTAMGQQLGTPAYMSPEQAAGRLDALGPASDVYSLGATLYCLLTGKPPFADDDPIRLLRKVEEGEFTPPRAVNAQVDRALDAVCRKAMALRPGDRYETPRLPADDIEHWLADEPVQAWREPFARRARRWARKNQSAVTAMIALLVVALLGVAAAATEARRERDRALRTLNDVRALTSEWAYELARDELGSRWTLNRVCQLSKFLLESRRDTAATDGDRLAAFDDHVERMREVEAFVGMELSEGRALTPDALEARFERLGAEYLRARAAVGKSGDEVRRLAEDRLRAARDAYRSLTEYYEEGRTTLDRQLSMSKALLEAECDAAGDARRLDAITRHLIEMKRVEASEETNYKAGHGSEYYLAAAHLSRVESEYLVACATAGPSCEEARRLAELRLRAARDAYRCVTTYYENGFATLDVQLSMSKALLEAECDAATGDARRLDALARHLAEMKRVEAGEKAALARRRSPTANLSEASYYRREAEYLLSREAGSRGPTSLKLVGL
jgi:tRNA A-37 threonylcarbamoyl transferase component Bud32